MFEKWGFSIILSKNVSVRHADSSAVVLVSVMDGKISNKDRKLVEFCDDPGDFVNMKLSA